MQNQIYIRYATFEDATLIADLSRKTFVDSFAAYNTKTDMDKFMNEQFTRDKLMAEVGDAKNVFLLAFFDQEVIGYAKLRYSASPEELKNRDSIEIARIYVVDQSIGRGAGSAIMERCLKHATEMNKEVIWLGVWEHNLRAIEFYRKWGFEKFGEHEFILGNDIQNDWLMMKKLT